MRVATDFLAPLLEGFADPQVFAVSCQIFFSDPAKLREETGLTQGWWQDGGLRVRHRIDPADRRSVPVLLWRRRILRVRPRKVSGARRLRSIAGALLSGRHRPGLHGVEARLEGALSTAQHCLSRASRHHRQAVSAKSRSRRCSRKTILLFCWKNIHEWRRLAAHFCFTWAGAILGVLFGDVPGARQSARFGARFSNCRRLSDRDGGARGLAANQRYRGVPAARWAGISAIASHRWRRSRTAARAFRFSLSDLPADPRRRRFHVPNAARNGETCRSSRGRSCSIGLRKRKTTRNCASSARPPNGWCAPRGARRHGIARTICRPRIRQSRSGMADPPPALPQANRCTATGVHADGAISRRLPAHRDRAIRARHIFPIDRRSLGHQIGALPEIKARVEYLRALRYELRALPPFRPGAGLHVRQSRLLAFVSPRTLGETSRWLTRGHRHFAVFV